MQAANEAQDGVRVYPSGRKTFVYRHYVGENYKISDAK